MRTLGQVPQPCSLLRTSSSHQITKDVCSHLASCKAAPCNPNLGALSYPVPAAPPSAARSTRSELMHPQDLPFQGCGEGDFLSACPYSEHARLCAAHQDYRPLHRNGLRVPPSWPSHISLYIIMELLNEGKTPLLAGTHLASSAPGRPP